MRIVHVYNELDPRNGGPPRVIAGLGAALAHRGHAVHFVSRDPLPSATLDPFLATYFADQTVDRRCAAPPFVGPLRSALARADVAHLHGIWPVITLVAAAVCRAQGVPYVLAPHGSLHRGALHEKRLKKWVGMYGLGFGAMVRGAAALHVLNPEEADGVPRWLRPRRIEVIPNGIFAHHCTPVPPGRFRPTVPGLGDAPFVLFLSRLHPAKGCDLLATAFGAVAQRRPDVHLVVAGGDQGGAALFEAGARRHGYRDRLHRVGELGGERKAAAFADAALFCLPSHHEGFSMAITEALAFGRPVVITETCHFPAVAEVGAGHIVPLAAPPLADALVALLADPEADARGARGRALVLERYRWEAIGARVEALYADLARPR